MGGYAAASAHWYAGPAPTWPVHPRGAVHERGGGWPLCEAPPPCNRNILLPAACCFILFAAGGPGEQPAKPEPEN